MKITKLEHASVLLEHGNRRVVVDPGSLTSAATIARLRGSIDAVLVTHTHQDHFDPAMLAPIGAPIFALPEVSKLSAAAGLAWNTLTLDAASNVVGWTVTAVAADHGPSLTQPIENAGFIVDTGVRVYVTGDMSGPQARVPVGEFAVVIVPVEGGGFVFDPAEAAAFVRSLGHTGIVIPVHADDAEVNIAEFVRLSEGGAWTACALAIGASVEV